MILKRRKARSSFGPDGRRLSTSTIPRSEESSSSCGVKRASPSSSLFRPGSKLVVRRASILPGVFSLEKKFQRPMQARRAYKGGADEALQRSSLGEKKRKGSLAKIFNNSKKGFYSKPLGSRNKQEDETEDTDESASEEEDRPYEPLMVWQSPHQGGPARGLPSQLVQEIQTDEFGVEENVTVLQPAPLSKYASDDVFVPKVLAKWLRPHQREGVVFMYECVMGMKAYKGNGCILADDMGLGKTLQSVTLIYTLLKTRVTARGGPTAKRVIVVCPCSLVKNWENEFVKWLGPDVVKTAAIAEANRAKAESDLDSFVKTNIFNVLICSYECLRTHAKRLAKYKDCCDLLVCDEAHRLKNRDNQTSRALNSLPVKRRVLLTGTPMQNDLQEFYAMVDFTNPGVLGTQEEFRKNMLFPILRGREPDASDAQKRKMMDIQNDMSTTVNEFILRRINTLNAEHLPPKLVQVVCCNLTEIQQNMYQHLITSKDLQHVMDGKQVNCLGSIQMLMKLCNHPSLVGDDNGSSSAATGKRRAAKVNYAEDDGTQNFSAPGADSISKFLPLASGGGRGGAPIHPEWSGKMFVLYRLMKEMRRPGNGNDKIVIISNYTQTLDLIGKMCRENSWGFCRLDGSVTMKKRQKMVDQFNDPSSPLIAFLLSSKAGGCGLNLIGGNRLVLFDPDWNPAVDKQAAARCWRDGQTKRCFTYRFLATGTVEEKIFQRQLSKEGLQSVVDDKQQVNSLSTKDLRNLFKLRQSTPSDTHDKLKCERCHIIADDAEQLAIEVLPEQLALCLTLIEEMMQHEDASHFCETLNPTDYGVSKPDYEKAVKQPMDLGSIKSRLMMESSQASSYKNISSLSKDVNRIFANIAKIWVPGDEISDASRRLQMWWLSQWQELVPQLMIMKVSKDETNTEEEQGEGGACTMVNERGEDYQEQIGMPDEENMRNWSHHHSTNTVDDPVFRAAMRGTDSVSFVFGLEVTWSLIQQRQQEEEERQAMEELEGMEEIAACQQQGSDDDDDEEEEVEEEDDKEDDLVVEQDDSSIEDEEEVVEDLDSESTAKPSFNEADLELTESGDDDDEEEAMGGAVEESATIFETTSPSVLQSNNRLSNLSGRSHPSLTGGLTTDTETELSSQDSTNKENTNCKWACPACTLINLKIHKKCKACNTPKPKHSGAKRTIHEID